MQGTSEIGVVVDHAATLKWIIGGLITLLMIFVGYIWKSKDSIDDELKRDMKVLLNIIPKIDNIENKVNQLDIEFKEHKKDYDTWKERLIKLWTINEMNEK